jgi:pyruvate dehydrogenase phosphatase
VLGVTGTVAAVSGGVAWYEWKHSKRTEAENGTNNSSALTLGSESEADTKIGEAGTTPTPPPPADNPAAAFVFPGPASRLLDHHADALRADESSMIIDDPTIGFSRSDHAFFMNQNRNVESINTFSRFYSAQRTCSFFALFEGYNGTRTTQYVRSYLLDGIIHGLSALYEKYIPFSPDHVDNGAATGFSTPGFPPPEEVDQAVEDAFVRLDYDLVFQPLQSFFENPSKASAIGTFESARSGASAVVGIYEAETRTLRVASSGKVKAVLGRRAGRRGAKSKQLGRAEDLYHAQALTETHEISNSLELARLQSTTSYPKAELERIFSRGKPTRSFGDAALKWSYDVQKRMHEEFLGDAPARHLSSSRSSSSGSQSPQMVSTAQPTINSLEIQPGDFLIVASDAIWGALTDEEAVGLVGWWVNDRHPRRGPPKVGMGSTNHVSSRPSYEQSEDQSTQESMYNPLWNRFQLPKDGYDWNLRKPEELPVAASAPFPMRRYDPASPNAQEAHSSDISHQLDDHLEASNSSSTHSSWTNTSSSPSLGTTPLASPSVARQDTSKLLPKWSLWNWHSPNRVFVNTDSNAATHLARNALGGADEDLRRALLGMGDDLAKKYRGDVVVSVIFFNDVES